MYIFIYQYNIKNNAIPHAKILQKIFITTLANFCINVA